MRSPASDGFGPLLRQWRRSRRMSQEQLALEAEVSARHLSFLETGRAAPSRSMVLVLGSALDLPLRDRNRLLRAAGFAAVYHDSPLEAEPPEPLRRTLALLLDHAEPYPAVAMTPVWDLVRMNAAAARVFGRLVEDASEPRVARNVMHAVFHPRGLRPSIVNWDEVSAHLIGRIHRDALLEPERGHRALLEALAAYPEVPSRAGALELGTLPEVCLPVHVKKGDVELRLFTTLSTLGTPTDAAAQELRIESYLPVDGATDRWLHDAAGS